MMLSELRLPLVSLLVLAGAACGASETNTAQAGDISEDAAATEEAAAPTVEAVDLSAAAAGVYENDPDHAYITFSYLHKGLSRPHVRWGDWAAELDWDPDNPEQSSVSVTIDAASADSGVDRFDAHLSSGDMFDAANYPVIKFESTALVRTGPNTGTMTGDLTILETTKSVTLDVTINGAAESDDKYALGFSAKGAIKRSDYGVDFAVPFVGDDVDITIEVEFEQAKEEG